MALVEWIIDDTCLVRTYSKRNSMCNRLSDPSKSSITLRSSAIRTRFPAVEKEFKLLTGDSSK